MTAAKIKVRVDDEGRLDTDAETLAKLKNKEFEFQQVGPVLTLEARPRKLHEIEDVAERMAAYEEFKKQIMRPGGGKLPKDWATIRDSIYD